MSIVLFYVSFVCKCVLLPPGVKPTAVKYNSFEPRSSSTIAKQRPNIPARLYLPIQRAHMKSFEAEVHKKGKQNM